MANLDPLFAMGIIALILLQSLDFELRWDNYQHALYVVLPPIAWSAAAMVEVLIERFIAA